MIYISIIACISYYIGTHYMHIQTKLQLWAFVAVCVIIFFTPIKK